MKEEEAAKKAAEKEERLAKIAANQLKLGQI